MLNEPAPNFQIDRLTKNFLKEDYQIRSKVREEKISEIKYKKLPLKDQIAKHQIKMVIATEKRERVLSRDKLFSKGGSKNADTFEKFNASVEELAKKIEGSLSKSQLTEISITRNTSVKNAKLEPKSISGISKRGSSQSKKEAAMKIPVQLETEGLRAESQEKHGDPQQQPTVPAKLSHKNLKILTKETFDPKKHPMTPSS